MGFRIVKRLRQKGAYLITIFAINLLMNACGGSEKASPELIDQMESDWRSQAIQDYHIIVDVERPGELRRNDVTVVDGRVTKGVLQYWETHEKRWSNRVILNESQAIAFSVPGLFDTVRSELTNGLRPVVRVVLGKNPPYIKKIILGQISQNNHSVADSQASIIVQKFEH